MADKVRWGVIGAGGIARRKTIPGLLEAKNSTLAAVMDIADINDIAKEFKVDKAYTNEADLVKDPDIDAVYIATPVHLHLKQITMAAEAGKHILCEKPLTSTYEEGKKSVDVCNANNVYLQEGYMMKFHGAHRKTKELIEAGKLGKITYMRAQLSCWFPPMEGSWRQDPKLGGGGAVMDLATHLYDLLEYFAGSIKRIGAFTGHIVHDYASEDSSVTMLEFANGAQATVDCFFCVPDEASRTRLEIYGSQGAILTEGTIGQSVAGKMEGIFGLGTTGYDATQNKDVERTFEQVPFDQVNPYTAECEYLADCIQKGTAPTLNNAANALGVLDLAAKAYQSSQNNTIFNVG